MTAEGPRFGATPQNPDLLRWIGVQVLLLVIAWVIGMVVRRLLASRMTMSTASATLTGLGGLWGGLLVAGWIFSSSDMWRPAMIGVAAAVALVVVVIVSLIVAYLHPRPGLDPIAEVATRGESDSLEFKSSARWNMRAGNSTRRLEVADAVQYVAARWPETVRVSPLTRARLFFTLRRHRDTPTRLPRVVERVLTEHAKHGVGSSEGE